MTKLNDIKVGDRVYYTGDQANGSAWLTVVDVGPGGGQYSFGLDQDGRPWGRLRESQIGHVYRGHCDPRFVTERAYLAFYSERLEALKASAPKHGVGWAGEAHECECASPNDSCPACSSIE